MRHLSLSSFEQRPSHCAHAGTGAMDAGPHSLQQTQAYNSNSWSPTQGQVLAHPG